MTVTMLGRLTASQDRTLSGVLIPYGVPGLTNLGRVTASRGRLSVPDDVSALHASLDHLDDRDSVAQFVSVEETDAGLVASWTVPKTHGGDRLLAEYQAGIRTGVSVELEPVRIRNGEIESGTVIGCAFPVEPAFPTARLVAELAPDLGDDEPDEDDQDAGDGDQDTDQDAGDGDQDTDQDAGDGDQDNPDAGDDADDNPDAGDADDNPEGDDVPTRSPGSTTAPDLLTAARANPTRLTASSIRTKAEFFALMGDAHARRDTRLLAALSDIVPSNLTARDLPQWVGEMWSGTPYQRRIVPLLGSGDLTGMKAKGWRWVTRPKVSRYSGNKTDVPSNAVETEPVEKDAQRFAGAHDIDRKYRDFNDSAFFASYYAAMTESYARETDLYAAEQLKAGATSVALGSVPSGVSAEAAAIVDAALAVIEVGTPTFALVEKSVYRSLILTPQDKFLEFLNASLGLEEGSIDTFKIIPVSSDAEGTASAAGLDRGEVVVGTRAAATWHELGGEAPIRVEAVDMVKGGIDAGVFGYGELIVHDARGIAKVDLTADM